MSKIVIQALRIQGISKELEAAIMEHREQWGTGPIPLLEFAKMFRRGHPEYDEIQGLMVLYGRRASFVPNIPIKRE